MLFRRFQVDLLIPAVPCTAPPPPTPLPPFPRVGKGGWREPDGSRGSRQPRVPVPARARHPRRHRSSFVVDLRRVAPGLACALALTAGLAACRAEPPVILEVSPAEVLARLGP